MKRRSAPFKWIASARYDGRCGGCGEKTRHGDRILHSPDKGVRCEPCGERLKEAEAAERREAQSAIASGAPCAREVYDGSDGAVTRKFLAELRSRGPAGEVAALLFVAQKASSRAKKYGMTYRGLSYDRKGGALRDLCAALEEHGGSLGITFGWGRDDGCFNPWVLYVELPCNGSAEIQQVSFHSPERYCGPDYPRGWDGLRASEERIIQFCDEVLRNGKP